MCARARRAALSRARRAVRNASSVRRVSAHLTTVARASLARAHASAIASEDANERARCACRRRRTRRRRSSVVGVVGVGVIVWSTDARYATVARAHPVRMPANADANAKAKAKANAARDATFGDPSSLGWRVQSSRCPSKARVIEHVSAKSLLALQAQVLRERARAAAHASAGGRHAGSMTSSSLVGVSGRDVRRARRGKEVDGDGVANPGVRERAARDATVTIDTSVRGVRHALERKSALYDKLARGEVEIGDGERGDGYDVDFAAKARNRDDDEDDSRSRTYDVDGLEHVRQGDMMSDDVRRELDRRRWEAMVDAEEAAAERAAEERAVIFDIEKNTERARDSVADLKRAREDVEAKKRERLKAAFMKKQLAKMKKQKT